MQDKPLFNWLTRRASGVLLHPTSLPGEFGIGTLGQEARRFLEFLEEAHMSYWQLLPLGPTGYGDSPYQSFSASAGNPYLIDLHPLMENGLLNVDELDALRQLPAENVDFGGLYQAKWPILRLAYSRYKESKRAYVGNYGLFDDFRQEHAEWLRPFALFMALKDQQNGKPWVEWPEELRDYRKLDPEKLPDEVKHSAESHEFYQYLFFGQWHLLRDAAKKRGISIVGDIPIFVSLDSSDAWSNPDIFKFDRPGVPSAVAGVPPDYFSPKGQLWGNPLFKWDKLKEDGYEWWIRRFEASLELYDVVRIDHFRGFDSYWEVPANAPDARGGKWKPGPGLDFFKVLHKKLPEAKIIAEDLGEITEDVHQLRRDAGLPGMIILQFAFSREPENLYLPCNIESDTVFYPGTHDNNTTRGWYDQLPEDIKDQVRRYLRVPGNDIAWDAIRCAYESVSKVAIIAAQDFLGVGSEGRLNTPGEASGNWQWRMTHTQLDQLFHSAPYLKDLAWTYNRQPARIVEERLRQKKAQSAAQARG